MLLIFSFLVRQKVAIGKELQVYIGIALLNSGFTHGNELYANTKAQPLKSLLFFM